MRIFFFAATIVAFASPASAGQTASKALTLDACIRLAEDAQSNVSAARQQSEIARYGLIQARAGFLPQIHFGNGYTYNSALQGGPEVFSFIALNGIREYNSMFTTALEVDTSGKLRAALARARADQDAAAANVGIVRRDLKRAVTAAYYRLLLTRRLIRVAQDALLEAQSFERRARLLFENGEVAQGDVIKAAAQVAFLQQISNNAQLDAQIANHDLASFWTPDVAEDLSIVDDLDQPVTPPEPASVSVERAAGAAAPFSSRPEVKLLDAEKRGLMADARCSRAELFPQANVVFQYGIDSLRLRIGDRGYAAFVSVGIPLFDWMRIRSQARQFDLRAQQIEAGRAIAERTFSRAYQDALARVRHVYQQISLAESQVKLSDENLRLSRLRFDGGEGLALDVVAAQNQLAQARTNYYTALVNYLSARADLEVAVGR